MIALELIQKTLVITLFVAVMMVVVEYANVWSRGSFRRALQGSRLRQYLLAALLGATPGCLGAFVVVTLHVQRGVTLGAVVAAMIATSGDEAFVMLAMVPGTAVAMTAGLVVLALLAGWLTDLVVGRLTHVDHRDCCETFDDHEAGCACFPEEGVLALWRRPRPSRLAAALALLAFLAALVAGLLGPAEWDWERIALAVVAALGLVIVATSSDEFFREHLWTHVVKEHAPRVALWIAAALVAVALLDGLTDLRALVAENRWPVLLVAALVGVVPTSGPHLVFVTLFASGTVPLSVLVTSSIVQDGHGMLPLLAHSRRDFLIVKGVNLLVGLATGAAMMAAGL